jgi:hypothetical protein
MAAGGGGNWLQKLQCKGREACEKALQLIGGLSLTGGKSNLTDYQASADVNGNKTTDEELTARILRLFELCQLSGDYFEDGKQVDEEYIKVVKERIENLLSVINTVEIRKNLTSENLKSSEDALNNLNARLEEFFYAFGKPQLASEQQPQTMFGKLGRDPKVKIIYTFLQDIYNPISYRVFGKRRQLENIISKIKSNQMEQEGKERLQRKLLIAGAGGTGPNTRTLQQKINFLKSPTGGSGMGGRRKEKKTRKRKSNGKRANKSRRR